jgi:hypothetical protein
VQQGDRRRILPIRVGPGEGPGERARAAPDLSLLRTGTFMLTGLLHAHSGLRYLILVAGVVALLYALFAVMTRRPYDRGLRATNAAFAGLLHLQVLLGFVLIVSGTFYPALIGHIFMMLFAAVTAQIPLSVMRRRAPEARTALPHLVAVAISLGLIWAGVTAIGRGLLTSTVF